MDEAVDFLKKRKRRFRLVLSDLRKMLTSIGESFSDRVQHSLAPKGGESLFFQPHFAADDKPVRADRGRMLANKTGRMSGL